MKLYPLYSHPNITSFKQLIDKNAEAAPTNDAFRYLSGKEIISVTYEQFRADINALGAYFLHQGLHDAKIAVIGENSYHWLLTYFATVMSGNVIVPIDKELPEKDIAELLVRCGAAALVHSDTYSDVGTSMLQALVDRHEILRTHFEDKDGHIVQVSEQTVSFQIEQFSTEDFSAFIRPFDLSKAPLFRVGYCENAIIVDMHHIITDGASMPIFLRELNELYMGRTLPPVSAPYRQFAMQTQDYSESEAYWMSVYSDEPPVLDMNPDFKREQKRDFSGSALYESFDSDLHKRILAASRKLGIERVRHYIRFFADKLTTRGVNHDRTKLEPPEVEVFAEHTPKLANLGYDTPEYKASLKAMGDALTHHYAQNRHHPEHFSDGILDMNLVDIVEMFCDWKAATERHHDGNLLKSIAINAQRFGYDDQLKRILLNTAKLFDECE